MIRILFIPQVSAFDVASESDVGSFKALEAVIRELEPASCFYWWLRRIDDGKLPELPWRQYFYRERHAGFYAMMGLADMQSLYELFNFTCGKYPVDVVFTSRVGVAACLQLALGDTRGDHQMPVVLTEPRVYGPDERGHNVSTPIQTGVRGAGYATCYGLYWSEWEKQAALRGADRLFTPGVLKGWEERSVVADPPVNAAALEPVGPKPETPKRLLWCGRFNSNKHADRIIEAYGAVLKSRSDVEVWVHAGTGAYQKLDPKSTRWHRTSERMSQAEYWELLRTGHAGAYMSDDEGANVTVQELLMAGVVLALPDKPWVAKLFHPYQYPFIAEWKSLPSLLDWMLDHHAEALAALEPIRDFIRRTRTPAIFKAKVAGLVAKIKARPQPVPYWQFRRAVCEVLEARKGQPMPWSTAIQFAMRDMENPPPQLTAACGMMNCYNAVRDMDVDQSPEPMLTLPKEATSPTMTDLMVSPESIPEMEIQDAG